MGDAGLNDQIGTAGPDQFLDRIDVLRHLDDRSSQPGEVLPIVVPDAFSDPDLGQSGEPGIVARAFYVGANVIGEFRISEL